MYKLVKFAINSAITSLKATQFCLMLLALLTMVDFILTLIGIDLPSQIAIVFETIYKIQSVIYKPDLSIIPVDFTLVVAAIEMLIMAGLIVYVLNFIIEFEQVLDKVQKYGNKKFEQNFNKQLANNAIRLENANKHFVMLYDVVMERILEKYSFDEKPVDIEVKKVEYRALFRTAMMQNFKVSSKSLTDGTLLFFDNIEDCNAVFNKLYEFSDKAKEDMKQYKTKFTLKSAICVASRQDSEENYLPKLRKLLNIAMPNKIMSLGDFKNKYEMLKDKPYKISALGEYALGTDMIDVYTLER